MTRADDALRTGWATVAVVIAMLAFSAIAWRLDDRLLNDVSIWAKPMKFNLSFALHLATLLVFSSFLRPAIRDGRLIRWTLILTSVAVLIELLYIYLQAARGRASHFNFETTWETLAYYGLMGGAAVVVMAGTLVIGLLVWRGARPGIGPGLHLGIVLGAVVGTVATFITAGALASGSVTSTGHWVGGDLSDAAGLPLFGWSTTGGDLRVPHFFATHLLQALPVLGLVADRVVPNRARLAVVIGAGVGVAIVWLTFAQALAGQPFLRLGGAA